jgi:hypothetical protein
MRTLVLCLTGAAAGIMAFNVVAPAAGTALLAATTASAPNVDRTAKSGRNSVPVRLVEKKIVSTVEVIGVGQAAVIYRDREGRLLFSADPVQNTTVVMRDTDLPQLTVRSWEADAAGPAMLKVERPAAPAAPHPAGLDEQLPHGCEPASSPLSPSGSSALRARCMASLLPARVAAIAR